MFEDRKEGFPMVPMTYEPSGRLVSQMTKHGSMAGDANRVTLSIWVASAITLM
jgi:hypothetical protein